MSNGLASSRIAPSASANHSGHRDHAALDLPEVRRVGSNPAGGRGLDAELDHTDDEHRRHQPGHGAVRRRSQDPCGEHGERVGGDVHQPDGDGNHPGAAHHAALIASRAGHPSRLVESRFDRSASRPSGVVWQITCVRFLPSTPKALSVHPANLASGGQSFRSCSGPFLLVGGPDFYEGARAHAKKPVGRTLSGGSRRSVGPGRSSTRPRSGECGAVRCRRGRSRRPGAGPHPAWSASVASPRASWPP